MRMEAIEKETVINFNQKEETASVYTRDPSVMRKLDALCKSYPEQYKLTGESKIDKTYEMPKSLVSFQKPRELTKEHQSKAKERMQAINKERWGK